MRPLLLTAIYTLIRNLNRLIKNKSTKLSIPTSAQDIVKYYLMLLIKQTKYFTTK